MPGREIKKPPSLGIVVPCFNEAEVIGETSSRLISELNQMQKAKLINSKSFILFVDDGSKDNTFSKITDLARAHKNIRCVKLSRNFGHQSALLAGLSEAKDSCDCTVSIDADLQDDVSKIKDFITAFREGFQIVYGVRKDRPHDRLFKKITAGWYYSLQESFGLKIVKEHADFRLLSKEALTALLQFDEVNLYLRGIVPLLGFPSTKVYYTRNPRFAGETKYPLRKMLAFAIDGITSFSTKPLRIVTYLGILVSFISIAMIIWISVEKFIFHNTIQGWASLTISIFFLGGIQMISLGVVGAYVGKIFFEIKNRPRFFVETRLNFGKKKTGARP